MKRNYTFVTITQRIMRRYLLHDTFNIYEFSASTWNHPVHKHTYYEIIYIMDGKGIHHLNGNSFAHRYGDIFLLGPEDYHSFDINVRTDFFYIRFNEQYLRALTSGKGKHVHQVADSILQLAGQSGGSIVKSKDERKSIDGLINLLRRENLSRHFSHHEALRDSLMTAILAIVSRNITKTAAVHPRSKFTSVEELTSYIRNNIGQMDRLSMKSLADKFNYSENYLSIFFKKHTGQSLKQYIIKQRLKCVETRLLYSSINLASIAEEFGFTDESHLCKLFRKYYGVSPREFTHVH